MTVATIPDPGFKPAGVLGGAAPYAATLPAKSPAPAAVSSSPFSTTKAAAAVNLKPGESVHFTPGKGYYAAPASAQAAGAGASAPAGSGALTYFTPSQLQADAKATADAELQGMTQPYLTQQAQQDATSLAQQQEAAAFNAAGSKLLGSIGPQSQAGYNNAAQETGQLGQGFSSSMQATLGDEQKAGQQFAASVGATGGNAPAQVDPSAFGNALYMNNGFIPASSLAAQGAAANQWGQGLKAVNTDVGRSEQQGLVASGQAADAKTAQQIADLAAKYPSLFSAAEKADIQQNLDAFKANTTAQNDAANQNLKAQALQISAADAQVREQVAQNQAMYEEGELSNSANSNTIRTASLKASVAKSNAQLKLQAAKLDLQTKQAVAKAGGINASASKVAGVIVLNDGTITKIPVNPKVYSVASSKNTPQGQYGAAVKTAKGLLGSPEEVQSGLGTLSAKYGGQYTIGKYKLNPSLNPIEGESPTQKLNNGFILPATTDDPSRAQTTKPESFIQAQAQIMAEYPQLSKAQARKALITAGIKPDGVKPGSYTGTKAQALSIVQQAWSAGKTQKQVIAYGLEAGMSRTLITSLVKNVYGVTTKPTGTFGVVAKG